MARQARGDTGDDGAAFSPLRSAQPVRPARLLHTACLGLEGQPARRVRELAPARLLQFVRRPKPLIPAHSKTNRRTKQMRYNIDSKRHITRTRGIFAGLVL